MKKLVFTVLILVISISCSKTEKIVEDVKDAIEDTTGTTDNNGTTDDNNNEEKDPLIGTWNLSKVSHSNVNDCEKKTTYVFKDDFTYTFKSYKIDNGNCIEDESINGEWKNKGNSVYYLKKHGYTSGSEGTFSFTEDNTVVQFGNVTYKKKK